MMYGQSQAELRPTGTSTPDSRENSNIRPETDHLDKSTRLKPSERFEVEYYAALTTHSQAKSIDEDVIFTGLHYDSEGRAKLFEYKFGKTDWSKNYNHGQAGVLYIYADDRNGSFIPTFVPEVVVTGAKPAPGWFQDGVGPLGRIAYELGGYQGIIDLKNWEERFSEASRIYFTYDAPLSSDIFSIAEGLTGKAISGGGTFTNAERAMKVVEGLKGIADLATGGVGGALYAYFSSAVDYYIDNYLTGETQKIVKEAKDLYDKTQDMRDISDKILKDAKR
jgi:hypothetical protein